MSFPRTSGILLHPTSLPGSFGIGDLGPSAYEFADFLVAAGQHVWQVLPLGPTGYGDSPYATFSAFAGNPLLISPELLASEGLLTAEELTVDRFSETNRVDFGRVIQLKDKLLRVAHSRYQHSPHSVIGDAFERFEDQNASWLEDYAFFRSLKEANAGIAWIEWDSSLAQRDFAVLQRERRRLGNEIEFQKFSQFLFFDQWFKLKHYCNDRGIKIVGDIPIFVAHDSADVWTNPRQFKLDNHGRPLVVAGVPPDYFSRTGQLWGNPLYDWNRMIEDGFKWWIERVRATLAMVDIVRVDHFRGFAASWEIPATDNTAENGRWVPAPGRELFTAITRALGRLPILAEDLGFITPDVDALRDEFDFPGMRILQFAFAGDPLNRDLPHNYSCNVVVYTGTHDNDTALGWFQASEKTDSTRTSEAIERERQYCRKYLNTKGVEINWDLIRAAFASVANTAIVPLQDVLGLGTEARMNLPNTLEGNWSWRFTADALTAETAQRLREITELYGRTSDNRG